MEVLLGALLLAIVAAFVLRPLLRERAVEPADDPRVADLEARKEAKYREIRDAELDHAAGKLSDADFRRIDAELRREAIELLRELDELKPEPPPQRRSLRSTTVYTILGVIQVIISVVLIFLVLLHSGKDTGLSGAFGIGGGGSSFGGGSMVEKNLDRATIFFAILFVLNTFVLLKI
jgi:preprotein translocase subunit SecG